jgi:hypothetical protein
MLPNVSDPVEYGLPFSDYDTQGVVDPTTEQTAATYEKHAVDCAAMTHVTPKAIILIDSDQTILKYDSVWGNDVSVRPTVTRNAMGDYTLTWAVDGYYDLNPTPDRRVKRAPNFMGAHATVAATSLAFPYFFAPAEAIAPNQVQVLVYRYDGNVVADKRVFVTVY